MADVDWATLARRVLIGAAAVMVLGVIAAVVTVVVIDRNVERVPVEGLGEEGAQGGSGDDATDDQDSDSSEEQGSGPSADPLTILVLGSDSREVLTPEERRELGTGYAGGERTESIMLVRLDPGADELRVLSIPRDTLITRCDGSRGRINAAYAIGERAGVGGATCVVDTLQQWQGVRIDHVVKVDFRGFVDIVDALGGVPIELDEPIVDERANLDLEAGCTRLDGAQALAFVRARSIDDDFGRMQRQQRFIEELRRELASVGVFDDAPRLVRTADAVARAVELDDSLTLNRIRTLSRTYRETLRLPVDGRSIPGEIETGGSTAFLHVEDADAEEYFTWLVDGEPRSDGYGDLHGGQDGDSDDDADVASNGHDDDPGDEDHVGGVTPEEAPAC